MYSFSQQNQTLGTFDVLDCTFKTFLFNPRVVMPVNVGLTCKSVDETVECDHSSDNCQAVLPCGTVY